MVKTAAEKLTELGDVAAGVEEALAAADHLGPLDAGAVAALRGLAVRLDALRASGGMTVDGKLDTVSAPTFLKYLEALGLTPAGRARLPERTTPAGGKLAELRARYRDDVSGAST